MPTGCPHCVRALEELVQEIRKMTTKNDLTSNLAAKMEAELQEAIAESNKALPDPKLILGNLNNAKRLIEGVASARGMLNNFAETRTIVRSHLP